jgi:hypothetical protein
MDGQRDAVPGEGGRRGPRQLGIHLRQPRHLGQRTGQRAGERTVHGLLLDQHLGIADQDRVQAARTQPGPPSGRIRQVDHGDRRARDTPRLPRHLGERGGRRTDNADPGRDGLGVQQRW